MRRITVEYSYDKYKHNLLREWTEVVDENSRGNGHHNLYKYHGPFGLQCLILERGLGWSFTVRYFLFDGRFLQWSAGKHEYWASPISVVGPCEDAAVQLERLLNLLATPRPKVAA